MSKILVCHVEKYGKYEKKVLFVNQTIFMFSSTVSIQNLGTSTAKEQLHHDSRSCRELKMAKTRQPNSCITIRVL